MKTTLVQAQPKMGDKEANLNRMKEIVEKNDSDLYVFPELYLTGYSIRDDTYHLAEPLNGPSGEFAAKLAQEHDTNIIFGMAEKSEDVRGLLYNSAAVAFSDGSLDCYRKMHMVNFGPFEEYTHFTPGNKLGLFRFPFGTIGVIICYDIFFPELTKTYTLQGADAVIDISASPSATRPFFETVIPARAIEDTIYFMYTNLVGSEQSMVFWGGAQCYGPRGAMVTKGPYFEEAEVTFELDMKDVEVARRFRPTIRDTRSDLLEELLAANASQKLEL